MARDKEVDYGVSVRIRKDEHQQIKLFCVEHGFNMGKFVAMAALAEMKKVKYKPKQ